MKKIPQRSSKEAGQGEQEANQNKACSDQVITDRKARRKQSLKYQNNEIVEQSSDRSEKTCARQRYCRHPCCQLKYFLFIKVIKVTKVDISSIISCLNWFNEYKYFKWQSLMNEKKIGQRNQTFFGKAAVPQQMKK